MKLIRLVLAFGIVCAAWPSAAQHALEIIPLKHSTVEQVLPTLRPLLQSWAKNRCNGENLSDFYQRLLKRDQPRQGITGRETPTRELVELEINR